VTALQKALATARAENRAALIGYLPVGYPDVALSIAAMHAMIENGVDIVEVGVPYSDPVMDGPTIQAAVDPAVRAGVGMKDALAAVASLAQAGGATVIMSYWNPIDRYGIERFAADLSAAGGSGTITPDLIPDEAAPWLAATDAHGLDRIFLVAPSSTEARIASTIAQCRGFVYAASTMGVTGTRGTVSDAARAIVERVRATGTGTGRPGDTADRAASGLPVCVGLGVSSADQAAEVAGFADGVIVGSAFVRRLLDSPDAGGVAAVGALAAELAEGVRRR
jgi:tryptophan synthase alpha chain